MWWNSDTYILLLDGTCTVLLILESLAVLVSLVWMVVALIIKNNAVKPLQCLLCTLVLSFDLNVSVYWDFYDVGFQSTEPIETSQDWIVQFHCYSKYSDEKLEEHIRINDASNLL